MLKKLFSVEDDDSTEVQYVGLAGISNSCLDAVKRYVQYGDRIERVKVLTTASKMHALLLVIDPLETVAVKSGFSSGYSGEGPRTFAETLRLLIDYGVDIEECEVDEAVMARLDASALTSKDLRSLDSARAVRPTRIHDYIYEGLGRDSRKRGQWSSIRTVMPWSLIDHRIVDLALRFFDESDDSLHRGFRRLEDIVRARIESSGSSSQLMAQAFQGENSRLTWEDVEPAEQNGLAQLFVGTYLAYRNRRAHRELQQRAEDALPEFLLLNHLFVLESKSVNRFPAPLGKAERKNTKT